MPSLQTVRTLWAALFASTVIFLVVLWMVRPGVPEPPAPMLLPSLALAALSTVAASFILPAISYRQAAQQKPIEAVEEPFADPARAGSDVLPFRETTMTLRKVAADPEAARQRALILYQTVFILKMAMAEAVALFGFVLHFMGFPLGYSLPFFVVCWALMIARFPTLEKVIAPLERVTGVHIPRA